MQGEKNPLARAMRDIEDDAAFTGFITSFLATRCVGRERRYDLPVRAIRYFTPSPEVRILFS
jgi:hypothetical protein